MLKVLKETAQIAKSFTKMYTVSHEYVNVDDGKIGLSAHAVDALGEIIFIESFVESGEKISAGMVVGEVESVKSVSEIYSPCEGVVGNVNEDCLEDVNEDPEGAGYMFDVVDFKVEGLMDEAEYAEFEDAH